MTDSPSFYRQFYNDGPDWPETPELQKAEREYRKAFLDAAREAANWPEPDEAALKKAWNARRQARRRAEESIDGAFVLYRPRHSVAASRARGRVHGFEFVKQCFDELKKAGVPVERIRPQVIVPWVEHVIRWAERQGNRTTKSPVFQGQMRLFLSNMAWLEWILGKNPLFLGEFKCDCPGPNGRSIRRGFTFRPDLTTFCPREYSAW